MNRVILCLIALVGILWGDDAKVFGKSKEGSYEGKIVLIEVGEKDLANG